MGIRQLDICNRVMAQAQGIAESDFPIDAFPAKVQCVILGMVRHENFKVEYLAAAMLSAAASALGNTYNIRVKRTLDNQRCPLYHHGGAAGTRQDTAA